MSDDQFTQLQSQMTSMQAQITGLGSKFNDLDKSFLKMFQYMTRRFDSIDKKLETKADKSTVDLIYNQLDSFLKRTDTDDVERTALGAQVKRHEGWIHQIAKTSGDKLEY